MQDPTTLEEALGIIKEQDRIIGQLTRENRSLTESDIASKMWLRKAKQEADYHDNISFDIVWKETLQKAKGGTK